MARLLKYRSALSVLHDDRGAVVFRNEIAHLTSARAKKILECQPGVLELLEQPKKKRPQPKRKAEVEPEVEPEVDSGSSEAVEIVDLRAAVADLHHSSRRAVARKLGGGDDLTTAQADQLIGDADDEALAKAAADQLEA